MVSPEIFVLLEEKSFLHWEIQTNGRVPALWRLPNPSCFGMLICVGMWSLLPWQGSQNYSEGFHFSTLSFQVLKKKSNKVWPTHCTEYSVFRFYLPFLIHFLVSFQARILEWVTISFSRGSSQPRDQTHIFCIGRWVLYHWDTWESAVIIKQWLTIHKKDPHIFPLRRMFPWFQLRLGGHGKWRHWTQKQELEQTVANSVACARDYLPILLSFAPWSKTSPKKWTGFFPD